MKIVTKKYKVYTYDELSEDSKAKAVNQHINDILECFEYEELFDNFKKAIDRAEYMKTPWFTGSYIWDYCKSEIEESLKLNEFLENGNLFIS